MTTTIRGNSGKKALRDLLQKHDDALSIIAQAAGMKEPFRVYADAHDQDPIQITLDELTGILKSRLALINTKLENLGIKIGDDVAEPTTATD